MKKSKNEKNEIKLSKNDSKMLKNDPKWPKTSKIEFLHRGFSQYPTLFPQTKQK